MSLFETKCFSVIVNPDNQLVPGILRILPRDLSLGDWNNWKREHWAELLQVIRRCEITLINTFYDTSVISRPNQDDRLINCSGKQRRIGADTTIHFDIVPRYKNEVNLKYDVSGKTVNHTFKDMLYGKPFDFNNAFKPVPELLDLIESKLNATLNTNDFNSYKLEDEFPSKDGCIACVPSHMHPAQTGLAEVSGFRVALDVRSQEEPGRGFCDLGKYGHVPALRYWQDNWMEECGDIFAAYRNTVNTVFPTDSNREFDWMCLMNLAKPEEGTHTHIHFIPRTFGGKNYGHDFSMDAATYVSMDPANKSYLVSTFQKVFVSNLVKQDLRIDWPMIYATDPLLFADTKEIKKVLTVEQNVDASMARLVNNNL